MAMRFYSVLVWLYAAAYILALAAFAGGRADLVDPSAARQALAMLTTLGLPWTLLWEGARAPDGPWLPITAPLLNLVIVGAIRRQVMANGPED